MMLPSAKLALHVTAVSRSPTLDEELIDAGTCVVEIA
jgi:hypothetical protein